MLRGEFCVVVAHVDPESRKPVTVAWTGVTDGHTPRHQATVGTDCATGQYAGLRVGLETTSSPHTQTRHVKRFAHARDVIVHGARRPDEVADLVAAVLLEVIASGRSPIGGGRCECAHQRSRRMSLVAGVFTIQSQPRNTQPRTGNLLVNAQVPLSMVVARLGAVVGSLLVAAAGMNVALVAPAIAKGKVSERGYAVVLGPGLAHPIVVSAPWKKREGGYSGTEAEIFLNLATFAGAIPGLVRPLSEAPSAASLGPAYQATYFRDCCPVAVHQALHPFAEGGPLVFTPSGQRSAMHAVFGRFWGGRAQTGWARAASPLVTYLVARGLPRSSPFSLPDAANRGSALVVGVDGEVANPSRREPTVRAAFPWILTSVAGLASAVLGLLYVRERQRSWHVIPSRANQ